MLRVGRRSNWGRATGTQYYVTASSIQSLLDPIETSSSTELDMEKLKDERENLRFRLRKVMCLNVVLNQLPAFIVLR